MKENTVKIIIAIVVVALIIGICFFAPKIISNNDAETSQNTDANNGYVHKETMEILFRDFNLQIEENSGLGTIFNEEFTVKEGKYWYKITDGIYLIVNPIENHNSNQDIVSSMSIYCEKDYKDDPQVPAYARLLIVANNKEIKSEEAQTLMDEAVKLASQNLASNNGKGISVKYLEKDGKLEYQVIRLYK